MKIWFDTEFVDDGLTIELISIGMVREDGATYYAENEACHISNAGEWVQKNVVPHLTGERKPRKQMKIEIKEFSGKHPEFWGYFADYDWVVLCQLFGTMMELPEKWPMFCMDVQQERMRLRVRELPKQQTAEHNALNDALWTRDCYYFLQGLP